MKVDETASSLIVSAIDTTGALIESVSLAIPELTLALDNAYWANYTDYQNRNLTADFTVSNISTSDALDLEVQLLSASQGVTISTIMPFSLGTLAASSSVNNSVNFTVP